MIFSLAGCCFPTVNVETSSSVDTLPARNMADEDIRTYWSAESGGDNEFAVLDLGEPYDVYAVQINFTEHNTKIFGREKGRACTCYSVIMSICEFWS